jgi:apolipoprotein N-acyltransferase
MIQNLISVLVSLTVFIFLAVHLFAAWGAVFVSKLNIFQKLFLVPVLTIILMVYTISEMIKMVAFLVGNLGFALGGTSFGEFKDSVLFGVSEKVDLTGKGDKN